MDAVADFIAGVTIGLIIIPQSVAYVAIIGLSAKVSTHSWRKKVFVWPSKTRGSNSNYIRAEQFACVADGRQLGIMRSLAIE